MGTSPNQLQLPAILVCILRKKEDFKTEMNACQTKTYRMSSTNWNSWLNFCEIRRKKAVAPTYCNLYAYAANTPVKYTDPDGRADFPSNWLMEWFSNNSFEPTQKDIFDASMNYYEQQFSTGIQIVQNNLSHGMEKVMSVADDAIISSAEFMSDYGGVIAIACYASGNIGLGMIVDGITIACDISLTAYKYNNGEISGSTAILDITSSIMSTASGMKCGSNFINAAERTLLDPKTTTIISNCISDFASQGISTLNKVNTEE